MVSPSVLSTLCFRRSSRLNKKTYLRNPPPVNYCPGGPGRGKKKISLSTPLYPLNKVLEEYADSIVYPDELLNQDENAKQPEETHEKKHIKGKAKKKNSFKSKQYNNNQMRGFQQRNGMGGGFPNQNRNFGPGGAQFQPGRPGGAQFQPNGPGGAQFQPGRPGGAQFQPGRPGGAQFQPGRPGGAQFQPGRPGGPQFQPNGPGGQRGEDNINPQKFINAPGGIKKDDGKKNFYSLKDSGVQKLMQLITPQRWKKDHSKEKKECFADLARYSQGSCGSCFIFCAVSFFSVSRCMATGQFVAYSHQDMVNCSPPATRQGVRENCQGGVPKYVWDYMFKNGVLEQSCQCYESHDGRSKQCNRNACKNGGQPKLTKPEVNEVIHFRNMNMIAYAIEYMGPVMGSIKIDYESVQALNNFNEGIQGKVKYDMNKLFGSTAKKGEHGAHAVVFVAYRIRSNKPECQGQGLIDPAKKDFKRSCIHFKIMNSWAGDWGKEGYAWIPSEMVSFAEIAFPTQNQYNSFLKLASSGDMEGSIVNFVKKFRMDGE